MNDNLTYIESGCVPRSFWQRLMCWCWPRRQNCRGHLPGRWLAISGRVKRVR